MVGSHFVPLLFNPEQLNRESANKPTDRCYQVYYLHRFAVDKNGDCFNSCPVPSHPLYYYSVLLWSYHPQNCFRRLHSKML